MKLLSLNVGRPREIEWDGQLISTGIYKDPVEGPVMLKTLNLDGDGQADLTVHGGTSKAAYLYPFEHYAFWKTELPDQELPMGMFGENFTTKGLLEHEVSIGDQFQIGGAKVMVTEPRMPCYKLGIKFDRRDILKRFLKSQRTGFYFSVLEEGIVEAGDSITSLHRNPDGLKITEVTALYSTERNNMELLRKAVNTEALPESWKSYFRPMLERLET